PAPPRSLVRTVVEPGHLGEPLPLDVRPLPVVFRQPRVLWSYRAANTAMEDVMTKAIARRSIPRRGHRMAPTWLLIGAYIGASAATGRGGPIEILSMMLGGAAVLPIVGVVLGLIGGDARGSVVGVAVGLLGGRLAEVMNTTAIQPQDSSVIAVAGGLLGAT